MKTQFNLVTQWIANDGTQNTGSDERLISTHETFADAKKALETVQIRHPHNHAEINQVESPSELTIDQQNEIISEAVDAAFPKLTNCENDEGYDHNQMRDERFSSLCNASTAWDAMLPADDFRARCDTFLGGEAGK